MACQQNLASLRQIQIAHRSSCQHWECLRLPTLLNIYRQHSVRRGKKYLISRYSFMSRIHVDCNMSLIQHSNMPVFYPTGPHLLRFPLGAGNVNFPMSSGHGNSTACITHSTTWYYTQTIGFSVGTYS